MRRDDIVKGRVKQRNISRWEDTEIIEELWYGFKIPVFKNPCYLVGLSSR